MNNVYQIKTSSIELKDVDNAKGIVSGYFSAFGNVDGDGDVMMKGAFMRSVNNNGPSSVAPRIKHLLNHNPTQPVGRLIELKEDDKGLYYRSQVGSHSLGKDFIKMAESGLITEHSVGFQVLREQKNGDYNEIHEAKLWEGSSLTAWGANPMTPLTEMKGQSDVESLDKKIKAIEVFCKNTDASDDTVQALLIQIKQLQQMLINATQPVTPVTLDPANEEAKRKEAEKQFKLLILKHFS